MDYDPDEYQEDNYDEFMISDDEVEVEIEMEDESDQSLKESDILNTSQNVHVQSDDFDQCDIMYQDTLARANSMIQEHHYNEAIAVLKETISQCQSVKISMVPILSQLIRCRYFAWKAETSLEDKRLQLDAFKQDVRALKQASGATHILDNSESFCSLINELAPSLGSNFILDRRLITDVENILCSKLCLDEFDWIKNEQDATLRQTRLLQYEIGLQQLPEACFNANEQILVEELYNNTQNNLDHLDNLEFLLAWYLFNAMHSKYNTKLERLEELVITISALMKDSFSKPLSLMTIMHFSEAYILFGHINNLRLNHSQVLQCNTELWESYKYLEEIGNKTEFRDLTLCGFILSNMLLIGHRTDLQDIISPFELEQVKILESELLQDLEEIYQAFVDYDMTRFANGLASIERFYYILHPLVDNLVHLLQVRKLWHHVAMCHSCISLADIQEKLSIDQSSPPSRNSILTIIMQSIMDETAQVYFKLDLTRDLVYFGEENRKPLSPYTKATYLASQSNAEQDSTTASKEEWVDNIGVFNLQPRRMKGLKPSAFVQELQNTREAPTTTDYTLQSRTLKYSQLAEYVRDTMR
ncbi:LANO_0H00870g1_1 [Lachancea nothofagi CBS 11611]|uniref:LANO_0H00870g1_1 n=1 Tax=Lachancea nothofagi CBS 11611 TaxID=1266666 RepID=A0A1G4KKS4_9SACH|nr:LANO_0H00870g1_1 [Lachancea nothofagi CBS 11611]